MEAGDAPGTETGDTASAPTSPWGATRAQQCERPAVFNDRGAMADVLMSAMLQECTNFEQRHGEVGAQSIEPPGHR